MNLKEKVSQMDGLVAEGKIVEAVETFFASNATTSDYKSVTTSGKQQMIEKMQGFTGAIANVNEIKQIGVIIDGNMSGSEFSFDFDMQDGTKINWHEIILRKWNDQGQVEHEEYFLANN